MRRATGRWHYCRQVSGASAPAELRLTDPGHEIDLHVRGHVRTMIDYWLGQCEFAAAVRRGELTVNGPSDLVREIPTWFARTDFVPG